MPLTAAQLLYASVEKNQSPRRTNGYQTLFYTHAMLTESDVHSIEQRLLYVHAAGNPKKGLFFPLGQQRIVIARLVPLEETDVFGRKGRYFAHALVFDRTEAVEENLNPFDLLKDFPFLSNVDDALAAGVWASGDLPPLAVEPRMTCDRANPWPSAALQRLTLYALRAEKLAEERRALAFIGQPDAVESAISAGWSVVPAELRPACSFDSFFNDGNFSATPFWAVGLPQTPPPGRYIRVDAVHFTFLDDQEPLAPRTAFEQWAVARLANGTDGIPHERETAYTLCKWLEGELAPTALPQEVEESVLADVFCAAPKLAEQRVYERLTRALPPTLATLVWHEIQPLRTDRERYQELCQGFPAGRLAQWLWTRLTRIGAVAPALDVQDTLGQWLTKNPDVPLKLLCLAWRRQWQAMREELARLEPAAYGTVIAPLLQVGRTPPRHLLLPGSGEIFVREWMAIDEARSFPLPELVGSLLEQDEAGTLTHLIPSLRRLDHRELRDVQQRLAASRAEIPSPFANALAAAIAAQPSRGVLSTLHRWLNP